MIDFLQILPSSARYIPLHCSSHTVHTNTGSDYLC
jgi:hypothetical protein